MTQLTRHPASLVIEDQLDAIGHKHRLVQLVRGAMLWAAWGLLAATIASMAADVLGMGWPSLCVLGLLLGWLILSAAHWMARPLIMRPSPEKVARLVEERIDGLHNGLSNTVLLGQAEDISQNPWLGPIYEEILANCRQKPLESAVRFAQLGPLGLRLGAVVGAVVLAVVLMPNRLAHGWQQMLTPGSFVPKAGSVQIIDVQPGDITLVAGQPLEISVKAKSRQTPPPGARLVFDGVLTSADLPATVRAADDALVYSYRADHVDAPLRYRVEIGDTQSNWYSVQIVPKVTLTSLDVKITPPAYTRQAARALTLTADHPQVAVPQGSRVEIGASIDVAAKRAVLMLDNQPPVDMSPALANQRFFREVTVANDETAYVGILGGDQIIAKLPENGLSIHSTPDEPPVVTMHWPSQDVTMPPTTDLTISADLRDDYGLRSARLLVGFGSDDPAPLAGSEQSFESEPGSVTAQFALKLTPDQAKQDAVVTVQVEATDNRDLTALSRDLGPQIATGPKIVIHFRDPKQIADEAAQQVDQLSARLRDMIKLQQSLLDTTTGLLAPGKSVDRDAMAQIGSGQDNLRQMMRQTGQSDGSEIDERVRLVKKTLLVLAVNDATEAVDLPAQIIAEPQASAQLSEGLTLKVKQESIIETLTALLARLSSPDQPATQPNGLTSPPMPARADAFKKLDEALKQYEKEQQRILDQTAPLAKKPVDDYDQNDKKKLEDLKMAQDKLDAFMQQALADFSKNAEQDMSNPSLLKDLLSIYTEVTMAKDALAQNSTVTAVPLEEMGLESAKELTSNMDKWLMNTPNSGEYTQEDPTKQNDAPEAELPKELQDMIGDLMQQQEDLDQQMQQQSANWQDSMDQAVGGDAKDGPISDNSAKGVTSNVLPNNNDVQGRGGQGRSAQSSGEMVGDTATDKGGRNTPTRLDPTPFQNGFIKDSSKDPAGGATGGGKISGEGAAGLEGPVPPKVQMAMKRLSHMQAEIRNAAEKLNLKYKLGRYDNFKLLQSIVDMRQVESDLDANRYQNALRHTDVLVNDMTTSSILLSGRIQVQQDTTPTASRRSSKEIDDAMQGELPAVWSESLREYYRKLAQQ
jgi:hypothetical protein